MPQLPRHIFLSVVCLVACPAVSARAQETMTLPNVVHVLGLENVKRNAKGSLIVEAGTVRFAAGAATAAVPIASIQDVFTGDDSRRAIGGTVGTLSMFAPYGSGRFLSLFRKKIDVLTLEYRDSSGALHGVVFTLPDGQAAVAKKHLVARGARASIPVEEEEAQQQSKDKKEKKP